MFTLFIPQPAEWLTLNSHGTRGNRFVVQSLKTAWSEATMWACREVKRGLDLPLPPCRLEWTFCMGSQRRRDPDNFVLTRKPILDALVKEGFWPDDDPRWVSNDEIQFTTGQPKMGVLIRATAR